MLTGHCKPFSASCKEGFQNFFEKFQKKKRGRQNDLHKPAKQGKKRLKQPHHGRAQRQKIQDRREPHRRKQIQPELPAAGIAAASRARKLSAIKALYKYLTVSTKQIPNNPVKDIEFPKIRRSLPKYLTLEESTALLRSVDGPNKNRDFAILMLFLNCGIRRSELVGLNLTDVYEDRIRVVGKGNKERIVYMGSSCRRAIDRYLEERNNIVLTDNKALFGSRDKNRISVSAVHRLVKKHLLESGLDASQFSAHKLRHTAATLMLANGVDLKTLQEVLGHENLNTTQIYTHIENTDKKIAAEANPLSKLKL